MADSITEGTFKSWLKQVGDTVAADDEVASIETYKVGPCSIIDETYSQLLTPNYID